MREISGNLPFRRLGGQLKAIRQKLQETIDEVSGAVEVDVERLESYEKGSERPTEDILMLLISHFGMQDDEAIHLWQLAGYDQQSTIKSPIPDTSNRSVTIMLALDTRVLYSDQAQIDADKKGLVLNFLQDTANGQNIPVSRIGMSYDQAKDFLQLLSNTLKQTDILRKPRALPAPKSSKKKSA